MKALLALPILLALALAGCSSSGPVTPEQDAEGNYLIHMTSSNKMTPMHAKVPAGANVTWVNDGGVHDVTADDGSWSSDDATTGLGHKMRQGETFTKQFLTPGTYEYHCDNHHSVGMKGTLIVE